jgi:hydroxyacylglutathione hydrolase
MLEIIQIPVLSDNYIYLLHEPGSGKTAAVDPALSEPVIACLNRKGWQLNYIFNTHHHDDHVGGNRLLKQQTGCRVVAASVDRHRIPGIDIEVNDGDQFQLGNQTLAVIATPGHTSGHIVYYSRSSEALFCGDTLFSMGCGRLFEGSAEQMWKSLQKLKSLPASTKVYCAHEYTQTNGRFALTLEADSIQLKVRRQEVDHLRSQNLPTIPSTIGLELATNPFFRENSASIRHTLAMSDAATAIEVFSRIRQMKDHFR